ncbi:GNAT family N-acetyltransferase [Psychroserpens sp. S379A]|uniref:GNAT family N-acetyltransferase n=1 Tax=Psychroserpens sp. S379A TaxID=3415137 RepID=UPI003C79BD8C
MKHNTLNTHNLGLLWTLAGTAFDGFKEGKGYFVSLVENSEWPNRIWVNKKLTPELMTSVISEMKANNQITFSHFNENKSETSLLEGSELQLKSLQYGMSLPLNSKFIIERTLTLDRVDSLVKAKLWSRAFKEAFQYNISSQTIVKTCDAIAYYLVKQEDTLVGTIILFGSNNTIGIHSLGIIPSQRKKGYAKEIMHHVLNMAIDKNYDLATLQASEMARQMYAKMGFSLDFMMENYILKQ